MRGKKLIRKVLLNIFKLNGDKCKQNKDSIVKKQYKTTGNSNSIILLDEYNFMDNHDYNCCNNFDDYYEEMQYEEYFDEDHKKTCDVSESFWVDDDYNDRCNCDYDNDCSCDYDCDYESDYDCLDDYECECDRYEDEEEYYYQDSQGHYYEEDDFYDEDDIYDGLM